VKYELGSYIPEDRILPVATRRFLLDSSFDADDGDEKSVDYTPLTPEERLHRLSVESVLITNELIKRG
jgi:hypothetical protein